MNAKTKKIISIVLTSITAVVCLLILLFAITSLTSREKGYTSIFGTAFLAVESDSMVGTKADSFNKGDMIVVKVLENDTDKAQLKVDQIITFWDVKDGKPVLNSHRIVKVNNNGDGGIFYVTKGDNAAGVDIPIKSNSVVGVYTGKIGLIGNLPLFAKTSVGFFCMVVIPSFLVVGYCAYIFLRNYKGYSAHKLALQKEEMLQAVTSEKELLKMQIRAELEAENSKQNLASGNEPVRGGEPTDGSTDKPNGTEESSN